MKELVTKAKDEFLRIVSDTTPPPQKAAATFALHLEDCQSIVTEVVTEYQGVRSVSRIYILV